MSLIKHTSWPKDDDPDRFLVRCACLDWEAIGTVSGINHAAAEHERTGASYLTHFVYVVKRTDQ